MLVLSRRIGESLMIGDSITVTLLDIKGGRLSIGIQAPREVAVFREEIYQRQHGDVNALSVHAIAGPLLSG